MSIEAGADALGFNFFTGSKRFIEPEQAFTWIRRLADQIDRVAVVVNADDVLLTKIRDSGCFEWIQFHGDETPEDCTRAGLADWLRAVRVKNQQVLQASLDYQTPHLLLDAWSPASYGGTGDVADWKMVQQFVSQNPERNCVLAGGLNPENVAEAVRLVRPAAVDVAGGVDTQPRKKSPQLVKAFIDAVREAEKNSP
jgi:phosphoribosylanthranilate isomerase